MDVNLGPDFYMICARFANGATNTFTVPLQLYKDRLPPDCGFFFVNLCIGSLGPIHRLARVGAANCIALTIDTLIRGGE